MTQTMMQYREGITMGDEYQILRNESDIQYLKRTIERLQNEVNELKQWRVDHLWDERIVFEEG